MRRLSKIIMATGGVISMLAMCCLDSDGVYMYYAGAVCILGGFIAGAGYGLRVLSERRRRGGFIESIVPELITMTDEDAQTFFRLALTSEPAREFLRKRAGETTS